MENAAGDGVREECEITSLSLGILFQEAHPWVETMQVAVHLVNTPQGSGDSSGFSTYYNRNSGIETDSGEPGGGKLALEVRRTGTAFPVPVQGDRIKRPRLRTAD
jgi:hypothetical protein